MSLKILSFFFTTVSNPVTVFFFFTPEEFIRILHVTSLRVPCSNSRDLIVRLLYGNLCHGIEIVSKAARTMTHDTVKNILCKHDDSVLGYISH